MKEWRLAHGVLYVALLLPAASVTSPALAQPPKEPWGLTVEERIALRTSTDLAQKRVHDGMRVQSASARISDPATRPFADVFDGKNHPELFLPHEVFDELIKLAFSGSPRQSQIIQDGFRHDVRRIGFPSDFWGRLHSLSTIYIADLGDLSDLGAGVRKQIGRGRARAEQQLAAKQMDLCRSRADALDAARHEFGRERFDRFLYEVIAVNMFYGADRLPYPDLLQNAERGCR